MGVCCACFVLVVVIEWEFFKAICLVQNDIATLDGEKTITFVKNDLSQSSINLNVNNKTLSNAEIEMLLQTCLLPQMLT